MWQRVTGFFDPLRARLALALAVALVPIVIYDLVLAYRGYHDAQQRGWDTVRQLAIVASNSQNALIEGTRRLLVGLGESDIVRQPALGTADRECGRAMARIVSALPEYSDLAVVDERGQVRCSAVDRSLGASIADTPWFAEATRTGGFTIGYFALSRATSEPIVTALLPTAAAGRDLRGALLAGIRLPWLGSLAQNYGVPPEGVVYLLDAKGTVMTSSDKIIAAPEPGHGIPESRRAPVEGATPDAALLKAIAERRLTEFAAVGADGEKRLYSSANLQNGSLFIVFGLPAASAISWSHYQTIAFIVGPVIMLLIAIAAAMLGGEMLISRGIRSLQSAVDAYSRNELAGPIDVGRSAREIRQFAQAFAGMAERITLREGELRRSLDEKDALLREVHHRVKNNLQIVTSFLNLQAKSVTDPPARRVLTEARMRVRALSIVHRYLYESADVRYVDFTALVRALGDQIGQANDLGGRGIALEVAVDPVPIPASAAVPVALFITEALSNAGRHAFPEGRGGTIRLTLEAADGEALLRIADDGIGMPDADPGRWPVGIGLSLMRAFARQLDGELQIEGTAGTEIVLRFRLRIDAADELQEVA